MGWKAACVFINESEPGYLGTLPPHDSAHARSILPILGMADYELVGPSTLEQGIYPKGSDLHVGVYPGALVIGSEVLAMAFLHESPLPLARRVIAAHPHAQLLAIALHSVVNLWGFAYYENGQRVCARAGSSDDGTFLDVGPLLEEEVRLRERLFLRDDKRIYLRNISGKDEEFTEDCVGEEFVFALSARFLGEPLDQFDTWDLPMSLFRKPSTFSWATGFFNRAFGKRG